MPGTAFLLGCEAPGILMELVGLPPISAPLPWHAHTWAQLNKQLHSGQLPHALLFAGAQYTGKSQLALALARRLLCQQCADGLNCGRCHACELSASGSHGDLRWLQPEDKSRVIKIDQVRQVVEFTNRTAGFGQCKVVVLAPADSMNTSAANALLKSLEEPAPDTYLILVCHRLHGVPATVRSRCQMVKLETPDVERGLQWLDSITGQRQQSEKLLELAGGLPLLAEQLYRDDSAGSLAAVRLGLRGLLGGQLSVPEVSALLTELGLEEFLAHLAVEVQGLLRALPGEQLATAQARAAFVLMDEIVRLQRAVSAGANPGRQLLIEALLAKCRQELGDGALGDKIQAQTRGS